MKTYYDYAVADIPERMIHAWADHKNNIFAPAY